MDRDNVVVYTAWPVSWSGIWVGTLAALAVGLIIGLIGTAVGAHKVSRYVDWKKVRLIGLLFSVAGAFFAFVVGGWVAARIAGITHSETAILHGAIVWLVALPLLLAFAAFGLAGQFGGWYGGLSGVPAWAAAVPYRSRDRKDDAQYGGRQRGGLARRIDRVGHRGLDGLRRAHDPHALPQPGHRHPARAGQDLTHIERRESWHSLFLVARRSIHPDRHPVPARRRALKSLRGRPTKLAAAPEILRRMDDPSRGQDSGGRGSRG